MRTRHFVLISLMIVLITTLPACSQLDVVNANTNFTTSDEETPVVATKDPPPPDAIITDPDGSTHANEARVTSGDDFNQGIFERPFSAEGMLYQPDLDIMQATIASDEQFYYFTLTLKEVSESTKTLSGIYGIEFDRSKTGRGDLLVTVQDVAEDWSQENIQVFIDPDKDIGGPNPLLADAGFEGTGYESQVKLEDSKLVYASLLPGHSNIIQIAISRDLLENASEFLWGAWADKGVNDPGAFDYNDRFSAKQAGSPVKDDANYPLAALHNMDNTCRQAFGFVPQKNIPGSCLVIPQAADTEPKSGGTPPFCCPSIKFDCCTFPGSCCGDEPLPGPTPTVETKKGAEPPPSVEEDECSPKQTPKAGECTIELEAQIECDGVDDIITINTPDSGFTGLTASSPGFTCSTDNGFITCTGAKQDAGTLFVVEVCANTVPESTHNCKDFPNTFWVEELSKCIQLGSSCCPIGEEWLADEARCIPIVSGNGKATEDDCGDAYVLVDGYCVYKGATSSCCSTVEIAAPCCFYSCVPGYVLDPATRCCNKAPIQEPEEVPDDAPPPADPCAGVNCERCCIAGSCPSGCCTCGRQ